VKKLSGDIRILVWVAAAVLVVIVAGAFLAPAREDNDVTPNTYNSGSHGAKGAWLLLSDLGYKTDRWERSAKDLGEVDAPHTTLILADAYPLDALREKPGIADFLKRGGRVLATGAVSAAMLPESDIAGPNHIYSDLCYTTPQGLSPMARAGRVGLAVPVRWKAEGVNVRADQNCGDDAVVVHYASGKGEVVWWSSSDPLSNRGLKQDASLKLFLASLGGPEQTVMFDEYIHGARPDLWATAAGTPVKALEWQLVTVAALLIFSHGRHSGPLRALVRTPRTSPLEFAESMGDLYRKAGAVSVATGCAERRLMQFLEHEGGIPRETLRSSPEAIAEAVAQRFRYAPAGLVDDLKTLRQAEFAKYSARSGLMLVKRVDEHISRLRGSAKPRATMRHSEAATAKHGERA
jgi:hypothetical protein